MIQQILSILDAAANGAMPIHERIGLAEMRSVDGKMRPTYYIGGTEAKQIVEDHNGSVSYWRMLAPFRQSRADENMLAVCTGALKRTYPLRLVVFMDRSEEVCSNMSGAMGGANSAMAATSGAIEGALDLLKVEITAANTEVDPVRAAAQELPGVVFPIHKAMAYVDLNVEIQGEPGCFDECADPVTVTVGTFCEQVQSNSWDRIEGCLTDEQEAAAILALCGTGADCGPLTLMITVEGQGQAPLVIDTCVDNTVNISVG